MLDSDELVLALVDICADEPGFGRTTLQKLAYLSTAGLGWARVGHDADYYGPFSRTVERDTARLVALGIIEEASVDLGFIGTGGFPAKRFTYRLSPKGDTAARELASRRPRESAALRGFVDGVKQSVGGLDQAVLSLAAKVHYIVSTRGGEPVGPEGIKAQAATLGWRISDPQILRVINLLKQLALVREARVVEAG